MAQASAATGVGAALDADDDRDGDGLCDSDDPCPDQADAQPGDLCDPGPLSIDGGDVDLILPQQAQSLVLARLVENRHLDRGNPNPGNLGSDFVRFGVEVWPEVSARDSRNASRQKALGFLVAWKNAIAHQDFSSAALTPSRLRLATLAPLAFGMQRSRARVRHRTRGVPDEPGRGSAVVIR